MLNLATKDDIQKLLEAYETTQEQLKFITQALAGISSDLVGLKSSVKQKTGNMIDSLTVFCNEFRAMKERLESSSSEFVENSDLALWRRQQSGE